MLCREHIWWQYVALLSVVTCGELAGMWVLGVCVALDSAWVTYDLYMEKMRCCYL